MSSAERPLLNTDIQVAYGLETLFGDDTADTPAETTHWLLLEEFEPPMNQKDMLHKWGFGTGRGKHLSIVSKITYPGRMKWVMQDARDSLLLLWSVFGAYVRMAVASSPYFYRFRTLLQTSGQIQKNQSTASDLVDHTSAITETQSGQQYNKSFGLSWWTGDADEDNGHVAYNTFGIVSNDATFSFEEGQPLVIDNNILGKDGSRLTNSTPPTLPTLTKSKRATFTMNNATFKFYGGAGYGKIISGTLNIKQNYDQKQYNSKKPSDSIPGKLEVELKVTMDIYHDATQKFLADQYVDAIDISAEDLYIPQAVFVFTSEEDPSNELALVISECVPKYDPHKTGEDKDITMDVTYTCTDAYASYKTVAGAGDLTTDTAF